MRNLQLIYWSLVSTRLIPYEQTDFANGQFLFDSKFFQENQAVTELIDLFKIIEETQISA